MFKRLAHVCIGATDLAATERFYVDALGMEIAFDFVQAGERVGFYLRAGDSTFIEVFAEKQAPNFERAIIRHFCLEVADLDAVIAAIANAGIEVSPKKLGGDGAWQAWITDPSGAQIELMQYSAESSQFSGRTVDLS